MWRIFLPERDKALQVLRQSDRARLRLSSVIDVQSKQALLQASAYNQHIPLGVVEGLHGGSCGKKRRLSEELSSAALSASMTKRLSQ